MRKPRLNYDNILALAKVHKPNIIVAGASAYPEQLTLKSSRLLYGSWRISYGDMAHIAGLVAGGQHMSRALCSVVTTTTHKTLRTSWRTYPTNDEELARDQQGYIPGYTGGP
ncbi:MAG: hypothetical protein ACLS48_12910 [[Eubacterium] siraeum]